MATLQGQSQAQGYSCCWTDYQQWMRNEGHCYQSCCCPLQLLCKCWRFHDYLHWLHEGSCSNHDMRIHTLTEPQHFHSGAFLRHQVYSILESFYISLGCISGGQKVLNFISRCFKMRHILLSISVTWVWLAKSFWMPISDSYLLTGLTRDMSRFQWHLYHRLPSHSPKPPNFWWVLSQMWRQQLFLTCSNISLSTFRNKHFEILMVVITLRINLIIW